MTRPAGPWAALQADFLATPPAGPILKQVNHVIGWVRGDRARIGVNPALASSSDGGVTAGAPAPGG